MEIKFKISTKYVDVILIGLILFTFTVKLISDFFIDFDDQGKEYAFTLEKDYAKLIFYDDHEIAKSALYFIQGKGFVTDVYFDRPQFNTQILHKTALRPKALIFFHSLGLRLFFKFSKINPLQLQVIPPHYFYYFSLFIASIKNILLGISLIVFYHMSKVCMNRRWALIAVITFLIFPSVCFYVGKYNIIDTVIMPLNVIFWGIFILDLKKYRSIKWFNSVFLGIILMVLILIKPHHLLYIFPLIVLSMVFILNSKILNSTIGPLFLIIGIVGLGIAPIIYYNYVDFQSFFLSNQAGFNFFHGHNPVARGSWSPLIWEKYASIIDPMLSSNSLLPTLNEREESQFYQQLAMDWIYTHPVEELELMVRKALIYFLPHNFMCWQYNPFNFFVYIFSLISIIYSLKNYKKTDLVVFYVIIPIVCIFTVNLLFFVEYRWRYYTEPFMVFLSIYFVWQIFKIKNNPTSE